jgi:hypothetical protein
LFLLLVKSLEIVILASSFSESSDISYITLLLDLLIVLLSLLIVLLLLLLEIEREVELDPNLVKISCILLLLGL